MDLNQTISLSPHVISQEVAGETVLLDLDSEHYFGLDTVGTRVWQLIGQQGNLRDIFATLLEEYDVDQARLLEDLTVLIDEVTERGLATMQPIEESG